MKLDEIRARHQEFEGWCVTCMQGEDAGSVPWPCDAAKLLAKLEAVNAELDADEQNAAPRLGLWFRVKAILEGE